MRRLKVLLSAYACEPNKGSEPEVGWRWALQMARFHEVTVLTRANNREAIEAGLGSGSARGGLRFVYHDLGPGMLAAKRRFRLVTLYYLVWQRSARRLAARLHADCSFDLMHHVTFAGYRYPVATSGHGVPAIWGPVGGIQSIPRELWPWRHAASLAHELARNADNLVQGPPLNRLRRRAAAQDRVLVSTREMAGALAALGIDSQLMPTIGLETGALPVRPRAVGSGRLRLLFAGQIITLKGADLAIEALAAAGGSATLTFIGSGNYQRAAERQARALGLSGRVRFAGRVSREAMLRAYADFDVLLFPSIHDTGSYAVIEAMFNELPVICLDLGGPAVAVTERCGVRVRPGARSQVVADLAAAIRFYEGNAAAVREHGAAARAEVLRRYEWDRKGEEMNRVYLEVAAVSSRGG